MHHIKDKTKRQFLKTTGWGLLAATGFPGWLSAMEMSSTGKQPPRKATPGFQPDVELELVARMGRVPILPGRETDVMQYVARVMREPGSGTLTPIPGSYLGPLLRLQKGQKVRVHFKNELPDPTITHWHGLHVPAEVDGHPEAAIGQGETFVYEFEVNNRASLNIYHPHPHENTARQVYGGLAGGLIVHDEEESRLGLPQGEYEIPLVLQDRRFDDDNQLVYVRHRMDRMTGFYGDRILVNGRFQILRDELTAACTHTSEVNLRCHAFGDQWRKVVVINQLAHRNLVGDVSEDGLTTFMQQPRVKAVWRGRQTNHFEHGVNALQAIKKLAVHRV